MIAVSGVSNRSANSEGWETASRRMVIRSSKMAQRKATNVQQRLLYLPFLVNTSVHQPRVGKVSASLVKLNRDSTHKSLRCDRLLGDSAQGQKVSLLNFS